MALPKIELCRANRLFSMYSKMRASRYIENGLKLLYIIKGDRVVLIESQANYDNTNEFIERLVAQFEYRQSTKIWSLFGYNRDSKSMLSVRGHLEKLIQVMDEDLTGVFWTESENRTRGNESHIQ